MVLKSRSISSCVILQMLSARHWAVIGPCFFFLVRLLSPRLVSPFSHWWALKPTNSITARSLKSTRGNSFMDSPPSSTFRRIQQHKLHRGDQRSLHSRQTHLFKRFQHPQFFEKHKKFIQQPCIAEMMHLIYGLSRIQCLCDFPLISPGNLPIESFLHHTFFFRGLFALHAFSPFGFSTAYHFSPSSLSLSPAFLLLMSLFLYQNVR